ncbi:HEAT repeat domain-containing protein [Halosolutus gelatinilyticus]|uniref:HEAT repeat domain-containing protein n=1 Tax=Halosolutus gelatinilyticus TaxID=2931975 RepID=UPI002AB0BAB2|nr:HEAT repeat domain-containing protein [Halosolutus gelatinilyticus]
MLLSPIRYTADTRDGDGGGAAERSRGPAAFDLPSVLARLDDDSAHVRASACVALGHGRAGEAADRLNVLAEDDPDSNVRERAAWARGRLP